MNAKSLFGVVLLLAMATALGQSRPHVVTVCDIINNPGRYANRAVIVVGRHERSVSLIDNYDFLSQDECASPIVTEGQTWPNKMEVFIGREEGIPKPPANRPKFKANELATKLSLLRQTTPLGTHEEPQYKSEGNRVKYAGQSDVPNEWAVAYGLIIIIDDQPNTGFNPPVAIIVEPYNFHGLKVDGTLLPQADQ